MSKTKQNLTEFLDNQTHFYVVLFFVIIITIVFWMYISSARYAIQSRNYPQAELLYEDSATWQANVQRTSLFYWVSDDIDAVREYYEALRITFHTSEDDYGGWIIACFLSKQQYTLDINQSYIIHNSLCEIRQSGQCITVSLVDVSQPDFWQIAVMSPSSFRYAEQPFNLPSNNGTLIIYSYAHADF